MGLGPGFLGCWTSPPLCQQATSIQCVKYGNTFTGKSFCWHTGGMIFDFLMISIYSYVNWLFFPRFYTFEAYYIENGFHCHKYSGQGSFTVNKGTIEGTTRVYGAKRPGLKIEVKRLGGNVLGAKRLLTAKMNTSIWHKKYQQWPISHIYTHYSRIKWTFVLWANRGK